MKSAIPFQASLRAPLWPRPAAALVLLTTLATLVLLTTLASVAILASPPAQAAPGAHGPDGEHLSAAAGPAAGAAGHPRFEASSEAFEVVGRLVAGELSLFVSDYESNAPVEGAEVDVEVATLRAGARYRPGRGDYVVDDAGLVAVLAKAGEHPLVITVLGDTDGDLLAASLVVAPSAGPATGPVGDGPLVGPTSRVMAVLAAVLAAGFVLGLGAARLTLRAGRGSRADLTGESAGGPVLTIAALAILLAAPAPEAAAAPGAHGPDGEHLASPAGAVAPDAFARLPDGSVNVPMLAQRRLGIRTRFATESEVAITTELPGITVIDPNAGGQVQTTIGGRIAAGPAGLPVAGQAVREGEILAEILHQPDPVVAANQEASLADIRNQRELARARLRRLTGLAGTVPRKEIEEARSEIASLGQREQALGLARTPRERLAAPVTGVIARAEAVVGQVVEPRDRLFEIVDPARLLVEAMTADPATAADIGGAALAGVAGARLDFLGANRVMRDGLLPLTFRVTGLDGPLPLALGQPVTVIVASRQTLRGFVLPAQAITRQGSAEAVIWIKAGAERYLPQPVAYRRLDATSVVVTRGLGADNRVVVEGASLIAQSR